MPGRRRAVGLLKAAHPLPATAVALFTAALTIAVGHQFIRAATMVAAVTAGQLSVGWCNDRVDLRRDVTTSRSDKPLVTGETQPSAVAFAAVAALAVCVPLSLACGLFAGCVHLCAVAAAWGYNLRLKSTPVSWAPYALAFGLLPAFVTLGLPGSPWPPGWLMTAAALLGAGAHFANVLPDIEDDLATAVRGLPQRLGARRSAALAALLVLASTFALVGGPAGPVSRHGWWLLAATTALCLLALLCLPTLSRSRVAFFATMAVAGADLAQLLVHSGTLTELR